MMNMPMKIPCPINRRPRTGAFVFAFFLALAFLFACGKSDKPLVNANEYTLPNAEDFMSENAFASTLNNLRKLETEYIDKLEKSPRDDSLCVELGFLYLDIDAYSYAQDGIEHRKKAREMFDKALALNPGNVKGILGKYLVKEKWTDETIIELAREICAAAKDKKQKQLCQTHAGDPGETSLLLAGMYLAVNPEYFWSATGRRAKLLFEKAIEKNPRRPFAYASLARTFGRHPKTLEQAVKIAREGLRIAEEIGNIDDIRESQHALGTLLIDAGQTEEGEKLLLAAAMEKKQDWACAYQALGTLYRDSGKLDKSAQMLVRVSEMYKDNPDAAYSAARALFGIGEMAKAEKLIDAAIQSDARKEFYVFKAFCLLMRKKYDEAKNILFDLQKDAGAEAVNRGVKAGLGHLAIIEKDEENAVALLEPLCVDSAVDFYDIMACLGLGWIDSNRGDHARALEHFGQISKDNVLSLLGKANAYTGLDQMDRAEGLLSKVLEISPGNPYATAELSMIYLAHGEYAKAEEGLRKAITQSDGQYTCPYEGLGLMYVKTGDLNKAKENLKIAIELNPQIEYKKYNALAKIYIEEGKIAEAKELLAKSIENYPHDAQARELLEQLD